MYNYSKYSNSILKDELICDDIKNFIINCREGKNETDELIFAHEFNRRYKGDAKITILYDKYYVKIKLEILAFPDNKKEYQIPNYSFVDELIDVIYKAIDVLYWTAFIQDNN